MSEMQSLRIAILWRPMLGMRIRQINQAGQRAGDYFGADEETPPQRALEA